MAARERQARIIADIGQKALATRDIDGFFQDVCTSLCSALECGFAKMLKLAEDGEHFIGIAGAGWKPGTLEASRIDTGTHSQAGYTMLEDHSVLIVDLESETRFQGSQLTYDHGVRSGIGALITVGAKPWGVISLHDTKPGAFGEEDLAILESASNIIAMTIKQSMREDFLTQERLIQSLSLGVAEVGVWTRDLATGETTWDQRLRQIVGVKSAQITPQKDNLIDFVVDEDRERVREGLRLTSKEGHAFEDEYRLLRPDGETVWLHTRAERTVQNNRSLVIGITIDVTERKHSEERSAFMMRELDHRVKNLLAIILSIAEITARTAQDVQTYKGGLRSRLEAVARTHSLLADTRWSGVNLRDLIVDEVVGKAADGAVTIDGPDVPISPGAAQSLSMLFHELNTNAQKFGSLSVSGGKLAVLWYKLGGEDGEVVITWTESDGPIVTEPTQLGFGSKVINQIVKRQFGARVSTQWDPAGMNLSIRIPNASIQPAPAETPIPEQDEEFVSQEKLHEARVLVADHEWLEAEQFGAIFASLGSDVVGPFLKLDDVENADLAGTDVAILDLGFGEAGLRFAERLRDAGIALVLVTQPGASFTLPDNLSDAPVLTKPASADVLIKTAARLLR